MKNCVFTELSVVSFKERKARRVLLDRRTTVFLGPNDTGKSSLLKSLYWAFGAEPSVTHPRWSGAEIAALVRFEIDGEPYQIARQRDQYVLLSGAGEMIAADRRVTTGIGPKVANLFDFGLVATDRSGNQFVPPPAFLFLPYYIDQEASWKSNWSGFARLDQVRNHRTVVAEYHTGIRPNSYYQTKGELDRQGLELKRLVTERSVVAETKRSAEERLPYNGFNLDPDDFAADVDELLREVERLAAEERSYRDALQELRSERHTVQLQERAVAHELAELQLDYRYATAPERLPVLECPTCGTLHENSFLDRFGIARDVDRLEDLRRQLEEDRKRLDERIAERELEYKRACQAQEQLEQALAASRGAITLRDVIESEGRKQIQQVFRTQLSAYDDRIASADARIGELRRTLRPLTDRERRERIVRSYQDRMSHFLDLLNVDTLPRAAYEDIGSRIKETGSDLPRALLAYYYSILHTIRTSGSSVYCPIVIDSPNQQGQDHVNLPAMLRFIFERRPEDSQLIVACEDLHGVDPGGLVVPFETRLNVLSATEYEDVAEVVRPILANAFTLEMQ